jgi:3'-5' exoribonuclease
MRQGRGPLPGLPSGAERTVRDTLFVRQMQDGCEVDCVLLVRRAERRGGADGPEYVQLVLGDRTGSVPAVVWDAVPDVTGIVRPGRPVHITGRVGGSPRQLVVQALRVPAPGSWRDEDLHDGPPRAAAHMEEDLRSLVATVQDAHLGALLDRFFGEGSEAWARYSQAPAAKSFHQAYRHGLLEHSLTVAQAVSAVSAIFPGIDRDVAVTGALLHDIGKLEAYAADQARIDLTDAGRLQGEISLGYYAVRRAIEEADGFPPRLAEALLHIILAHHGSLEHGSPVVPCTREATLVHFIDNLGGRLGSFDRLEKGLAAGERWSAFDRAPGGTAYFPWVDEGPAEAAA